MEAVEDSAYITIKKDGEFKIYVFIPLAEPMSHDRLKKNHDLQRLA